MVGGCRHWTSVIPYTSLWLYVDTATRHAAGEFAGSGHSGPTFPLALVISPPARASGPSLPDSLAADNWEDYLFKDSAHSFSTFGNTIPWPSRSSFKWAIETFR